MPEGYDADGNLMDVVGEPSPDGEGGSATALTDEVCEPQTPADCLEPTSIGVEGRLSALAAEVRTIEEQVRGMALSGAIAIGRRLVEAKGLVPRGRWGEWLATSLDYSERRAQDLKRLFETYGRGTIPESVSALDYSKAVALLGAPEEAREALAEQAQDMSVRELQAEVKRLKTEKLKAQMAIDDLEGKVAGQTEEIARLDERERTYDNAIRNMEIDMNTLRGTADAANRTAEALRKERDMAKTNADTAARRASDAVTRANETQAKLTEAEAKIKALEAREPERVEVVPPEVEAELERLRHATPRGEAEVRFRLAFFRLGQEFKAVQEILGEVVQEDADKGAQFAVAVVKACQSMIQMLGEASE